VQTAEYLPAFRWDFLRIISHFSENLASIYKLHSFISCKIIFFLFLLPNNLSVPPKRFVFIIKCYIQASPSIPPLSCPPYSSPLSLSSYSSLFHLYFVSPILNIFPLSKFSHISFPGSVSFATCVYTLKLLVLFLILPFHYYS